MLALLGSLLGGAGAIKALIGALGVLAGAATAFLAGRRSKGQADTIAALKGDNAALKQRSEIDAKVQSETDLVAAARAAGVVRGSNKP